MSCCPNITTYNITNLVVDGNPAADTTVTGSLDSGDFTGVWGDYNELIHLYWYDNSWILDVESGPLIGESYSINGVSRCDPRDDYYGNIVPEIYATITGDVSEVCTSTTTTTTSTTPTPTTTSTTTSTSTSTTPTPTTTSTTPPPETTPPPPGGSTTDCPCMWPVPTTPSEPPKIQPPTTILSELPPISTQKPLPLFPLTVNIITTIPPTTKPPHTPSTTSPPTPDIGMTFKPCFDNTCKKLNF